METDEDSSGALGAGEHGGNAQKTGQCAETFDGELAVAGQCAETFGGERVHGELQPQQLRIFAGR